MVTMPDESVYLVIEQDRGRDGEDVLEQYPLRAFDTESEAEMWRAMLEDRWKDEHTLFDPRGERPVFKSQHTGALIQASIQKVPKGVDEDDDA